MKFRFDPQKQSKKPKVDEQEPIEQKLLPEKVVEKFKWEPKSSEALPPYPAEDLQIKAVDCPESERYLCLYEAYFTAEIDRLLGFYAGHKDYVYFCTEIREKMLRFLKKERQLKQKYMHKPESLHQKQKRFELLGQLREYENQIQKLRRAQQHIERELDGDMSKYVNWIELKDLQNEFDEEGFKQRLQEFESRQAMQRIHIQERVKGYVQRLLQDKRKLEKENEELEREIAQLEGDLAPKLNPYRSYSVWL